ncbi:hypothetical protein BCUN_2235 [Bifidobacterium cuniculi]|uniref:Lactococcin 972 family bacteriocin n=1 Tax=Bifidobacterium cuniculi TaxID=1688 RepID=A0A087ADT0_9BIFI|nr:hypothetical protein [Bifidobacterium cuniculi]KFI56930.1 hypothetical protein BCUN_2235 [Bifidobacterium cuniculi]
MSRNMSLWKKVGAVGLALGVAFSTANIAYASATATYIPYSSGSIEGGYFRGSRTVTYTSSAISMYSVNQASYCEAKQSGNINYDYMKVGQGKSCSASQTGTATTAGDYAKYIVG